MKHEDNLLKELCSKLEIDINEKQSEQFEAYYRILIEKNKVMNLTAITEYEDVVIKHFVDSLCIAKYIDLTKLNTIIDIGSGAGFPGIPLKIVFPHLKVCLLDSLNKRVKFLNDTVQSLDLQKINAVHGRAENLGRNDEYREQYDACVSRAVANISTLTEYCTPFIKKNGIFAAYKTDSAEDEIKTAGKCFQLLNCKVENIEKYNIPSTDIKRALVFIRKYDNTSNKYPRKEGIPSKQPL